MEKRKVNVIVRRGKGDRSIYLYATVKDAETNELLIDATLEYVLKAAMERQYEMTILGVLF